MDLFTGMTQKQLKELFTQVDVDNSGCVSLWELRNILAPSKVGDAEIVKTFALMDKNNDGRVRVGEFVSFVMYCKKGQIIASDHKELVKAFDAADANSDKQLSLEEISNSLGCSSDDEREMVHRVFHQLDTDNSGSCSLRQLSALLGQEWAPTGQKVEAPYLAREVDDEGVIERFDRASQEAKERVKVIFRAADTNGDGVIGFQEFLALFKRLPGSEGLKSETLEKLFSAADSNRDGGINYDEFLDWLWSGRAAMGGISDRKLESVASDKLSEDAWSKWNS